MEKIEFQGKKIVGIKVRTRNTNNQAEKDMSKLWADFMSKNIMEKIPNKIDSNIYCIYTNYESDFTGDYDVILGCEASSIDNLPSNLVYKEIPNMNGIIFIAKGQIPESIVKTWNKIWTAPLDRAYIADIEKYKFSDFQDANAVVEIFISMKQ